MRIGEFQELEAVKETPHGYYFADGDTTVLLPRKECPENLRYGDRLNLFILTDSEDRPVATLKKPTAKVGEFGLMRVVAVTRTGAFLDWGLDKDLYCPIREQLHPLRDGEDVVVRVYLDEVSNRVVATTKLGRYLEPTGKDLHVGQPIEILVAGRSPDALTVIINGTIRGSLYRDEQIERLNIGDVRSAYVKAIRAADGKVAVSLRPQGFDAIMGESQHLLKALREAGGTLPVSDKSSPEEIQRRFGLSKGAFKKLIGALYREGKIDIGETSIRLR